MGRIKTTLTKRTGLRLFNTHKSEFTKNFEKNKGKVEKFADIPSKKIRNIVAGYIARLVKQEES
ncbi:30S ribosomal protein S17e [Patescibacteria group bacterium]|nr:30S ribosomal protein S17e [Patescibacteria group bacterium]